MNVYKCEGWELTATLDGDRKGCVGSIERIHGYEPAPDHKGILVCARGKIVVGGLVLVPEVGRIDFRSSGYFLWDRDQTTESGDHAILIVGGVD